SIDSQGALASALDALERGELTQAESECRSILLARPRHYGALEILGQTLARTGREDEAISAIESAAKLAPAASYPFTFLATTRFRRVFGAPVKPRAAASGAQRVQMRSLGS